MSVARIGHAFALRESFGLQSGLASASEQGARRGQRLGSLLESSLGDRFFSWRGASGENYVCSIFPVADEATVALFSSAVIVGVARNVSGARPICVLSSRQFDTRQGRVIRDEARAMGCAEWHVRFDASEDQVRDLAASLLN
jgi:hypothetical protein